MIITVSIKPELIALLKKKSISISKYLSNKIIEEFGGELNARTNNRRKPSTSNKY